MGLDQYAGTMREETHEWESPNGDGTTIKKVDKWQQAGPFQWRKHARLQEFMNTLYMEKNEVKSGKWESSTDDSGKTWTNPISWTDMELNWEDIDRLEKAVKDGYHDYFCDGGFFWGHQFQEESVAEEKEKDMEFVEFARAALEDGEKVFYSCSW